MLAPEIQEELNDIFKPFGDFCKKNNLLFFYLSCTNKKNAKIIYNAYIGKSTNLEYLPTNKRTLKMIRMNYIKTECLKGGGAFKVTKHVEEILNSLNPKDHKDLRSTAKKLLEKSISETEHLFSSSNNKENLTESIEQLEASKRQDHKFPKSESQKEIYGPGLAPPPPPEEPIKPKIQWSTDDYVSKKAFLAELEESDKRSILNSETSKRTIIDDLNESEKRYLMNPNKKYVLHHNFPSPPDKPSRQGLIAALNGMLDGKIFNRQSPTKK